MHPAFSVIFLTTLSGVGQGLFLALYTGQLYSVVEVVPVEDSHTHYGIGALISLLFLGAALFSSFFHLGHPERAWRAIAMWRTSWLSREACLVVITLALFTLYAALWALGDLRLAGMVAALEEQLNAPDTHDLDFEERLGLLVDREMTMRHNRRLHTRLKQANFHQPATWEDIDLKTARGLDKALMLQLAACQWIDQHLNCLICGPTGVGKSQTTRYVSRMLKAMGKKVVAIRHPMPYGNLRDMRVQRFRTIEDIDSIGVQVGAALLDQAACRSA